MVGGQRHVPAVLPSGKTQYPLYRRLGGPQSRSGQVQKISPPPGFDARTVQPVASRYNDYAMRLPPDTLFWNKAVENNAGHSLLSATGDREITWVA